MEEWFAAVNQLLTGGRSTGVEPDECVADAGAIHGSLGTFATASGVGRIESFAYAGVALDGC
jgi:hypothetical protein